MDFKGKQKINYLNRLGSNKESIKIKMQNLSRMTIELASSKKCIMYKLLIINLL